MPTLSLQASQLLQTALVGPFLDDIRTATAAATAEVARLNRRLAEQSHRELAANVPGAARGLSQGEAPVDPPLADSLRSLDGQRGGDVSPLRHLREQFEVLNAVGPRSPLGPAVTACTPPLRPCPCRLTQP